MSLSFDPPNYEGELWEFVFERKEPLSGQTTGKINYRMPEGKAIQSFGRTHRNLVSYSHRLVSVEEQKAKHARVKENSGLSIDQLLMKVKER